MRGLLMWQGHKNNRHLCGVAVAFFALMCLCLLGSLPDNDRHGKHPDVEGQAHTNHPLSQKLERGVEPTACVFVFALHRPFRAIRILQEKNEFVNVQTSMRRCAPPNKKRPAHGGFAHLFRLPRKRRGTSAFIMSLLCFHSNDNRRDDPPIEPCGLNTV